MALYIDLDKIAHTEEYVRYKYYNNPDDFGVIELNFVLGEFIKIKSVSSGLDDIMFDRAAMKIIKHWRKGEFPDKTCWAS